MNEVDFPDSIVWRQDVVESNVTDRCLYFGSLIGPMGQIVEFSDCTYGDMVSIASDVLRSNIGAPLIIAHPVWDEMEYWQIDDASRQLLMDDPTAYNFAASFKKDCILRGTGPNGVVEETMEQP